MSYENSGERERYSESEDRESTEDHEHEESPDDMASEAVEDLEREEEAERAADRASRELDEMESDSSKAKDITDEASRELDQEERSLEDELGHDLHETRDDLHERFVNDMERQLDGPSHKEAEAEEKGDSSSSSETTESSESYHDAGDGMAYAMRTESGSEKTEATETEVEEEAQEVSESETQEHTEHQVEDTEEPVSEKGTNQIPRYESEEGDTTTSSDAQETPEYNDVRTRPEVSEPEEETREISEGDAESEPAESSEVSNDISKPSEEVEEFQDDGEVAETSQANSEVEDIDELEQEIDEILDSLEETELQKESEADERTLADAEPDHEMSEGEHEDALSGHESPEQEASEDSEVEAEESQESVEDESLPETLEEFVDRVRELLDERMEEDDGYDYVQDPLTGEIQRVPRVLGEFESDEERQRRRLRSLFVELSEEERERFKELASEEERSAEAVERAWGQVVSRAEQERQELLEQVREVLQDSEVRQLLQTLSEEDNSSTVEEDTEVDEVEEEESPEQYLVRGRLRVWIPRVNGERIESIERLEKIVRERYPSLLRHRNYQRYLRQARLHLELLERFQSENLRRGDMARISRETGESPTTIKRWLIEGVRPRLYHYLNLSPLEDRQARVAQILEALNGATNMETLERRLRTLFLYESLEDSESHAERLERARLFFQFLDEYVQGGMVRRIADRLGIGKSTMWDWLNGSQLPSYVRFAATIPNEPPTTGRRWLPLRLNSRTNLPEQFIHVPKVVNSQEDLLSVLRQLRSLRTQEMREFEERYGRESILQAFMYLLGLIVSDGGFRSDSDLSARVVLYASEKYQWSPRLGQSFTYTMGRIGLRVEQRADDTRVRGGRTSVFNVWSSQASPLLRWVKDVLLGLGRSHAKKETPIDADWILSLPHEYRVAFLQGLADGDGHASIRTNRVGIASKTNQELIERLFSSLNIRTSSGETKVEIKRHEDILKANSLPLFRHATSRKKNHDELCKIIGLLDRSRGKVPERDIKIIMELRKQGYSNGEITEKLWFDYGVARSRKSVEGIVRRRERSKKFD